MKELIPETFWSVDDAKKAGLYFYHEVIEEYLPGNRVKVAGHGEMLMPSIVCNRNQS